MDLDIILLSEVRQGVSQSEGGKNITFVVEKDKVADFILAVFTK